MVKYVSVFFLIILSACLALAQVELRPSAFYVDFATFKSDSAGHTRLEVFYKIYTSHLSHMRKDGKYFASYAVSATILKNKKQIDATENDGSLYSDTYEETVNKDSYIVNNLKFYLKPGKYNIEVVLNDLNASSSVPLETELEVPSYSGDQPALSSIEFVSDIMPAVAETTNFDKGRLKIIPSCSRRYGDNQTYLIFYYEIYAGNYDSDEFNLTYEVASRNNIVISKSVVKTRQKTDAFVDSLNLEKLRPGPYDLVLSWLPGPKKKAIQRHGSFSLVWSALELVKNDYKDAVSQLVYIASQEEMDKLREAPDSSHIQAWNDFWKSRDPSPGTAENEIENEYYKRLEYADRHFSLPSKEGWKTDMGMIYIINGEPDDIERHPFDIDTKPYQIWYYYNPRRRFLFIDTGGYGEYVLQYPYDGDVNKSINIYGGGP